jgi:hypothetical protein
MRLLMRPAGVLTGEALLDGGAGVVLLMMTAFALDLRDGCPPAVAAVFLAPPIFRAEIDENGEDEAEAPETRDLRLICTSEFSKALGDGLGARPE